MMTDADALTTAALQTLRLRGVEADHEAPLLLRVRGRGRLHLASLVALHRSLADAAEATAEATAEAAAEAAVDAHVEQIAATIARPVLPEGPLLPLIVSSEALADLTVDADHLLATLELSGGLYVVLAHDRDAVWTFARRDDLADAGLGPQQALVRAVRHVVAGLPEVHIVGDGVRPIVAGQHLEACLLLVPTVWRDLAKAMIGDPVVAVPTADRLAVADSADPLAVADLQRLAVDVYRSAPRPLTPALLRWTGAEWVVHAPN